MTLSLDEVDTEIVKTVPLTRPSWLAQSGPLDEDLVDEDSLLTEADLAAPTTAVGTNIFPCLCLYYPLLFVVF